MIVIKHKKVGAITYTSHIDTMRVLQRTLVRGKIEVEYSQGFNPHPITYVALPLPLGVASEAEYFVIADKGIDKFECLEKFNANVPSGLLGSVVFKTPKNPNIAGKLVRADYIVNTTQAFAFKQDIEKLKDIESYIITFNHKNDIKNQDIAGLIFDLKVSENNIFLGLSAGNVMLRPDRLIEEFNKQFNLDISISQIKRLALYIDDNGVTKEVDSYLAEIEI